MVDERYGYGAFFGCGACRKRVEYDPRTGWGYETDTKRFCSWHCLRAYEKTHTHRQITKMPKVLTTACSELLHQLNQADILTEEEKLEAIRAEFGEEMLDYLFHVAGRRLDEEDIPTQVAVITPKIYRTEAQRMSYNAYMCRLHKVRYG